MSGGQPVGKGVQLNRFRRGRYEIRSASGTAWWHSSTLADAFRILDSHGQPDDYVFDTVTGGRPGRDGKTAQKKGVCE